MMDLSQFGEEVLMALVLGNYMFTGFVFLFFLRRTEMQRLESARIRLNHLLHAERAINELRVRAGLPPLSLEEDETNG